jgi:hypothetical protein
MSNLNSLGFFTSDHPSLRGPIGKAQMPKVLTSMHRPVHEIFVSLTLLVACVLIPIGWSHHLRKRVAKSNFELATLESELATTSAQRQEAEIARGRLEAVLAVTKLLKMDREAPRWASALGSVAMATEEGVELQNIKARPGPDGTGSWELSISGTTSGLAPRVAADKFRQALEAKLSLTLNHDRVATRFEKLQDEVVPAGQQRAVFVIAATSGLKDSQVLERGR